MLPLLLGLAALALLVAGRKLKGLVRAAATAPDLLWERDDWEPPRLRLSTFRKPGKVAELTDLEALVLLGLPFQAMLAMLLDRLEQGGRVLRERAEGALRLARAGAEPPEDEPYLGALWERLPEAPASVPEGLAVAVESFHGDTHPDKRARLVARLAGEFESRMASPRLSGAIPGDADDPVRAAFERVWHSWRDRMGPALVTHLQGLREQTVAAGSDEIGWFARDPGLFVADGSVLPAAVGGPPALAIAAWAHHVADGIAEAV